MPSPTTTIGLVLEERVTSVWLTTDRTVPGLTAEAPVHLVIIETIVASERALVTVTARDAGAGRIAWASLPTGSDLPLADMPTWILALVLAYRPDLRRMLQP